MDEKKLNNCFKNEITMNDYTLREILLGIWTYKAVRNKMPVIIYLLAVIVPMIYAFVTGKQEYMLLAGIIFLSGLVCLLVYAVVVARSGAKKREKLIRDTLEKYGDGAILSINFGENIRYCFNNIEKTINYDDIEKIIEIDMYLILRLKNDVSLPVWKVGFTEGKWDDFIPYIKQKIKKQS